MSVSRFTRFAVIALAAALSVGVADAQQLNKRKHADPASQAKINRAMPQSRMEQGGELDVSSRSKVSRNCNLNVGNVQVEKGARAPREVNTVIRGDVINLCR